jgi:hypothetical protein
METQYLFSGSIRPTNLPLVVKDFYCGIAGRQERVCCVVFLGTWPMRPGSKTRKNTNREESSDFFKIENTVETKII